MKRALPVLLAFGLAIASTACMPAADAPPAAATIATPPELAQLSVQIQNAGGDEVSEQVHSALETALMRSNYRVAPDGVQPDLVLRPQAAWQREPSFVRFQRADGRETFKIHVRVALSALAKGRMVDQFVTEFGATNDGPIDPALMIPLLNGMARSQPLLALARANGGGAAQGDPSDPQISEHDKPKPGRAEDDREWASAGGGACARPTRLDACDKVRAYLARHPSGGHADEARRALSDSEPAFEKLQKDEDAWQRANPDDCRARKTREACVGVGVYVNLFPNGLHAREAKQIAVY